MLSITQLAEGGGVRRPHAPQAVHSSLLKPSLEESLNEGLGRDFTDVCTFAGTDGSEKDVFLWAASIKESLSEWVLWLPLVGREANAMKSMDQEVTDQTEVTAFGNRQGRSWTPLFRPGSLVLALSTVVQIERAAGTAAAWGTGKSTQHLSSSSNRAATGNAHAVSSTPSLSRPPRRAPETAQPPCTRLCAASVPLLSHQRPAPAARPNTC